MATPAVSPKVQELLNDLAELDKEELREFVRLLAEKLRES